MTVLSIETATAVCGVALVRDGTTLLEQSLEARHLHAERLLGMIDRTLGEAALTVREPDGIAVSIGPGSFTGLRIGLSVAKGLVFGLGKPLAAVPTLEALAWRLVTGSASEAPRYILATLDARRDEVYCQLFNHTGPGLQAAGEPEDLSVAAVVARLRGKQVLLTGDGAEKVLSAAPANSGLSCVEPDLRRCSAATVGLLGERLLQSGRGSDPATLEPRYVKEFFLRTRTSHKEGE